MLQSKRIKLRAIEERDLALIISWHNNPQRHSFFYEYPPTSFNKQHFKFEKQPHNTSEINLVISTLDGIAIGTVSLYNIDFRHREAEWGRLLIADEAFKNEEVSAEAEALILHYAFEYLNLHKLYCEVFAGNEKEVLIHQKFGFRPEAILNAHIFKSGKYVDVILLALFEDDYFKIYHDERLASTFKNRIEIEPIAEAS